MGCSSYVSSRLGPIPSFVSSSLIYVYLYAPQSQDMNIPSGHSVRALPSNLISIFLILVGLFNRSVSNPRSIAGGASCLTVCGRPRKSSPVDGPRRKMTGSVKRIWSGRSDLPTIFYACPYAVWWIGRCEEEKNEECRCKTEIAVGLVISVSCVE